MKSLIVFFLLISGVMADDIPALKTRPPGKTTWHDDAPFVGENVVVHNYPNAPIPQKNRTSNLDWRFITAHAVYGASEAFDLTLTKRGVSHGCQEANYALGPYPSTGRIVGYGIGEFVALTTMDYFLKRTHVPGLSYVGATIGTIKHITGGKEWLNQPGCL